MPARATPGNIAEEPLAGNVRREAEPASGAPRFESVLRWTRSGCAATLSAPEIRSPETFPYAQTLAPCLRLPRPVRSSLNPARAVRPCCQLSSAVRRGPGAPCSGDRGGACPRATELRRVDRPTGRRFHSDNLEPTRSPEGRNALGFLRDRPARRRIRRPAVLVSGDPGIRGGIRRRAVPVPRSAAGGPVPADRACPLPVRPRLR